MANQTQQQVINFFRDKCNNDMYDNIKKSDYNFTESYDEFMNHNINHIQTLDDKELKFLLKLSNLIANKKLNLVDEEEFVENLAIAFYFDNDYKLIIVNEN